MPRPARPTANDQTPKGGGIKSQKRPPGGNLQGPGGDSKGGQPSPSLSSGLLEPFPEPGELMPLGSSGDVVRSAESGRFVSTRPEAAEESDEAEESASSSEEWLSRNGAREMRFFSRRARSGKDPEFTKEWMKQVMAVQVAKTKAVGAMGAAAAGRGAVDPLVMAAQRIEAMDPAELVEMAGYEFTGDEE